MTKHIYFRFLITEKTNKNWNEFSFFIVELMRKSLFLIIQLDVL